MTKIVEVSHGKQISNFVNAYPNFWETHNLTMPEVNILTGIYIRHRYDIGERPDESQIEEALHWLEYLAVRQDVCEGLLIKNVQGIEVEQPNWLKELID